MSKMVQKSEIHLFENTLAWTGPMRDKLSSKLLSFFKNKIY